jgi:hypothetical protein
LLDALKVPMSYVKHQFPGEGVKRMLLIGGGAAVGTHRLPGDAPSTGAPAPFPDLASYLEVRLGMEVRRAEPAGLLDSPVGIVGQGVPSGYDRGGRSGPIRVPQTHRDLWRRLPMPDVNLIPGARLARKRRNTRLYVWAAFCGAYAMCLIAGAATWQALRSTEDRALHGQHVDLAKALEQDYRNLLDLRKELGEMTASLETTRAIHNQPDWSRLFLGLSDRLGDEIVLSHCRLVTLTGDNRPVWSTGRPPCRPAPWARC